MSDGYIRYTVRSGDTLTAIAARLGSSVDAIANFECNNIVDPNQIAVGQDLYIPVGRRASEHVVKSGQTAWAISRKYGTTVAELTALNPEILARNKGLGKKENLDYLEIGDILKLPYQTEFPGECIPALAGC